MGKEKISYEKPVINTLGTLKEITKGGGPAPGEPKGDPDAS